ncbi:MAG: sugar ABC transporter permease, partial [Hungatella sp.]
NGESSAMPAIIILGIWLGLGMDFLFLLSAVRGVSDDLLEAAKIDGANFWNQLKDIYIPMISPTLFYLLCTNLAASMMMSGQVIVLTKGGPNNSTSTIIYYMYKKAFEIYSYGASYAAAIIGFVFAFVMILISFRFEKKGVHYN